MELEQETPMKTETDVYRNIILSSEITSDSAKTIIEQILAINYYDKSRCPDPINLYVNTFGGSYKVYDNYIIERTNIEQNMLDVYRVMKSNWNIPANEALKLGICEGIL